MKIIQTIFLLTVSALLAIACQTNSTTQNNAANQTVNKPIANTNISQNTNQSNTNSVVNEAKTETNTSASISADTPTAAYKSSYSARKNKDIAALKKLIAKEMFEFFEILGEGSPNPLDEGLKQLCEMPQGKSDEVRNEKINGDKATLQYLDKDDKWTTLDLVKEDGLWKLTIGKMDDDKKSKK